MDPRYTLVLTKVRNIVGESGTLELEQAESNVLRIRYIKDPSPSCPECVLEAEDVQYFVEEQCQSMGLDVGEVVVVVA